MKMFSNILFMVFLLVFLASGSMIPNQAMATNDDEMQMFPEDGEYFGDLIMEQNGDANGGGDGDPDSLGDGFGFMGDLFGGSIFQFIDGMELTFEEYLCILMEQMIFAQ